LILFKPQLIIGLAILWLLRWRKDWQAILGVLTGGIILSGITYILLPDASINYLRLAIKFLPNMIYTDQFPLYHLHALRGFLLLLFPDQNTLVELVALLATGFATVFLIRFVLKQGESPAASYAAAIAFTILVTPHAMIYDWALLLVPAILLWKTFPQHQAYWKVIFATIWLLTLLSGPLTYLQLQVLPVAFQISVPGLIFVLISGYRTIVNHDSTVQTD
jgi:hypothetical protein